MNKQKAALQGRRKQLLPTPYQPMQHFLYAISPEGFVHHINGSSDWMIADPPNGTGTHEYAAIVGDLPCKNIRRCPGCRSPKGVVVCYVRIDPEDYSMELFPLGGSNVLPET